MPSTDAVTLPPSGLTDFLYQRDGETIAFARSDLAVSGTGSSSVAPVVGTLTDLGPGNALGINDLGQVVGYSGNNAVIWNSGSSTLTDLGILPGMSFGEANSINDAGVVVG